MIHLQEITTLSDLKRFVRFKYQLYRDNPYWVPPLVRDELHTLRWDENPAFAHCRARYWLAYRDGQPVGRVAGIINALHIERWQQRYVRFGWLDFIDDPEVSTALLGAVENWAREENMAAVHGPLGFTDLDYEGMLVHGFDELGTMATLYNFPYYPQHLERLGYRKDVDWVECQIQIPAEIPERLRRAGESIRRRGTFRMVQARRPKDLLPYAAEVFDLINVAYRDLYGVVTLTQEQIDDCIRQYFPNVAPDFVKVALDREGHVAGFVIALPSLSHALRNARGRLFPFGFLHVLAALKRPKTIDFYLAAVRPDLRVAGVQTLLALEMHEACVRRGIVSAESNIQLETNTKVQAAWKLFPHRVHKRRRCFIKQLE